MLITEGTDLSGKSTLISNILIKHAKRLATNDPHDFGFKFHHYSLLPEDWDYFTDYLKTITINGLTDRFVFSELVYGPYFRGAANQRLTQTKLEMIMMELLTQGSVNIYCRPELEVLLERYDKRTEGDEVLESKSQEGKSKAEAGRENLKNILDLFDTQNWRMIPTLVLNNIGDIDDLVDQCLDFWEPYRKMALAFKKLNCGGWGSLAPEYVVVGERPNDKAAQWQRPFSNPSSQPSEYPTTSGEFVFRLMREGGIKPMQWHVTNVFHSGQDKSYLFEEIAFLKPTKGIIAMGAVAQGQVKEIIDSSGWSVPVLNMPHPQYIRRFQHKLFNRWVDVLKSFQKRRGTMTVKTP